MGKYISKYADDVHSILKSFDIEELLRFSRATEKDPKYASINRIRAEVRREHLIKNRFRLKIEDLLIRR